MHAAKRLLILLVLVAAPAWAAAPAVVEAVQMPAWIERNGRAQPLAVGMGVSHADVVRTGPDARVYLKVAEGSTIKIGENARLALFSHSLKPRTSFNGALDVLAGAFRFTTDAASRFRSREVAIRVGTATAGIRGTDVWGRTNAQEDLICLLDGRIEVRHPALAEPVAMNVPMSFFVVPRGGAPKPVASVNIEEVRKWARQTEIEAGNGAVRSKGRWTLLLGRHGSESEALAQYDAARDAGFAVRIKPVAAQAGWNYGVVLAGFTDAADAESAALRLKGATGIAATVVAPVR